MPKTSFHLCRWAKRFAAFMVVPVVLCAAINVALCAGMSAPGSFNDGQVARPSDFNRSLQALQNAINELQAQVEALKPAAASGNPDCPAGYSRDTWTSAFVVCKKGVDQIVKVGTGIPAFWIDRYEATMWQNPTGSGAQYGLVDDDFPVRFPKNGQHTMPVYALSVAGRKPSAFMTWYQAQQACRLSGKRLPTDEEWLAAATRIADPNAGDGVAGCNTNGEGPRTTGGRATCVSRWGAEDMIGNVWEWMANWEVISISPANNGYHNHLPVVAVRGGAWTDRSQDGVLALDLSHAPLGKDNSVGFRCVTR